MKKFLLSILLLITLLLSGCNSISETQILTICGSYCVPGMFCWDLKGKDYTVEIIERDSYNRILFSYSGDNLVTGKKENAFIVCQWYDEQHVYFYEDICYQLNNDLQIDTDGLKERNDWESPLNLDKMSRRATSSSFDMVIVQDPDLDFEQVQDACCAGLAIDESMIEELCFIDYDMQGKYLYLLIKQDENDLSKYYVLINNMYQPVFLHIDPKADDSYELSLFKQANDWKKATK